MVRMSAQNINNATGRLAYVYPPDSRQPYPPPAGGQYYAPYGYQPYPNYQYPSSYAPPPKSGLSGNKVVLIVVIVVVLVVLIPVVLAGVLVVYLQTLPQSGGNTGVALSISVASMGGGNWIVSVNSGATLNTNTNLQVLNTNGVTTIDKTVISLGGTDPDATYNNNNGNTYLDAGDTILIRGNSGHALQGYRVQLSRGNNIIGGPKTLP